MNRLNLIGLLFNAAGTLLILRDSIRQTWHLREKPDHTVIAEKIAENNEGWLLRNMGRIGLCVLSLGFVLQLGPAIKAVI